ncbi:hypothetical protein Pelo_19566 [Pelomyxa schiedti]|nr:hypothetical protein Pelo_19566 [Pelomyxa schiedti]
MFRGDLQPRGPASASQCDPCPVNTFNPDVAGTCLPCGGGTTAPEGSTSCWNNCTFSPDGMTVFDLNGLKRVGDMYGPIYDQLKMSYYTNVCSLQHSNRSCYDRYGVPITGYACQVTNLCDNAGHCVGMNLGDVIGFYSGEQPTEGLIVSYTHVA